MVDRWLRICVIAAVAGTMAPATASAGPGDLDPAFGSGGTVVQPVGSANSWTRAVALQQDGKAVVALNVSESGHYKVGVARFTAAGALDPGYGTGGTTYAELDAGQGEVFGIAIDPQGRAVVAGYYEDAMGVSRFLVARYTQDGDLDPMFGPTSGHPGYVLQATGAPSTGARDVVVQPDGRIVVVGGDDQSGGTQGVIARFEDDGDLDPTFNPSGSVPGLAFGPSGSWWQGVALQGAKLLVAGWTDDRLAVARYNAGGTPDTTFGDPAKAGRREFRSADTDGAEAALNDIALDAEGRILTAGVQQDATPANAWRLTTARLTADGALDTNWNASGPTPGVSALAIGGGGEARATAIAARPRGGALVSGWARDGGLQRFVAGRFGADGTPTAGFGQAGFTLTPIGGDDATPYGAVRGADDTLLAAGFIRSTSNGALTPALARWSGDDPAIAVAPNRTFGEQEVGTLSTSQDVTITNPGEARLDVSALHAPPEFEITDAGGCDHVSLLTDQTCTFRVGFRPGGEGARSGRLTVASNAPGAEAGVDLSGTGTPPAGTPPATSTPPATGGTPPPQPDLPLTAGISDPATQPGDSTIVEAGLVGTTGARIVSYLWSLVGPDPKTITIDTGSSPKLLERPGPGITKVWVWAVDDRGKISDAPAEVVLDPPDAQCEDGATSGDLKVNWLHIRSSRCIKVGKGDRDDFVVPVEGGGASINGLEVQCPRSGACPDLLIRHTDSKGQLKRGEVDRAISVSSTGPVNLRWPNGQNGTVDLGDETLSFDLRDPSTFRTSRTRAKAARDLGLGRPSSSVANQSAPPPIAHPRIEQPILSLGSLPAGGRFAGLRPTGEFRLSVFKVDSEPGAKLTGQAVVKMPDGTTAAGPIAQEADAVSGVHSDGGAWEVDLGQQTIAPLLHFEELTLRYTPFSKGEDGEPDQVAVFEFEAVVGIDITGWTVQAKGRFSETNGFESIEFGFHRNEGKGFTGLNVPTGRASTTGLPTRAAPVQLDELEGHFQRVPYLSIGGTVKLLLLDKFTVGGSFAYSEEHGNQPWSLLASATFPINSLTVTGTILITGSPRPGFGVKGNVGWSFEDVISLEGFVYAYFAWNEKANKATGEFGLGGSLTVLSFELASFQALVNDRYLAGCGRIGLPGVKVEGWGAFTFSSRKGDGGFGGCDNIAKYSLVPALAGLGLRARSAAAQSGLRVPAGVGMANLEVRAADGLARVRVDGPGGLSYVSPATGGVAAGPGGKVYAMADAESHRTVIGLKKPRPGVYRVTAVDGAPTVVEARVAYGRPTTVSAAVGGGRARRTLRYKVDGPPGAEVRFDERSGDVASPIGASRGREGVLTFRSADLGGAEREIVALVTTPDGVRLPAQVVAHYRALQLRPKRPRRVRATFDSRRALASVRWARDLVAVSYDVRVATASGRRLRMRIANRTLKLKDVYPGERITVRISGTSAAHRTGPSTTLRVRVPQPVTKRRARKRH